MEPDKDQGQEQVYLRLPSLELSCSPFLVTNTSVPTPFSQTLCASTEASPLSTVQISPELRAQELGVGAGVSVIKQT